jgi:non-ribosomal peptide synthetase component E (peptide arylation enzyme)
MPNTLLRLFQTYRYEEHCPAGFWRDDAVYALVQAYAERTPDRIALRGTQVDRSYRQLLAHVDALAGDLACKGEMIGQRVAVLLLSRLEAFIALLSCSRNGYVDYGPRAGTGNSGWS